MCMKVCFNCLNSTSGMCNKHTQNLEKNYVSYTATSSTMSKNDRIEILKMEKEYLIKVVKKKNREFMMLYALLPIVLMMMILFVKSNLILFIGFGIFWHYADKFYKKLSPNK